MKALIILVITGGLFMNSLALDGKHAKAKKVHNKVCVKHCIKRNGVYNKK